VAHTSTRQTPQVLDEHHKPFAEKVRNVGAQSHPNHNHRITSRDFNPESLWVVLRFQRCVYEATKSAGFRGCCKTLRRGGFWVAQRFTAAITGPFSSRL